MDKMSTYFIFFVLSICILLGEELQSVSQVICVLGILVLYLREQIFSKREYVIDKVLGIVWALLFFVLIVSSFYTLSLGYSISNIIRYITAFVTYLYVTNKTAEKSIVPFMNILFYWSVSILTISYIYSLFPILQDLIPNMNLIYKSFGHNHVVDLLIFIFPYSLYLLKKKKSFIIYLSVVFLFFGILTSSSRGTLILISISSLYYLCTAFPSLNKIHRILISIFIISVGIFFIGLSSYRYSTISLQTLNSTVHLKTSIISSRLPYWTQAVYSIRDNLWIGHGPGTFSLISKKYQLAPNTYSWFAHNYLLQSLSEIGIFGLIPILYILYYSYHATGLTLRKNNIPSDPRISMYLGVCLVLLYSAVEINLDFIVLWVLFWIILGLLYNSRQSDNIRIQFIRVPINIPLFILGVYALSFSYGMILKVNNKLSESILYMPYSASVAEAYLNSTDPKNIPNESMKQYLHKFHSHNPDILALLAATEKSSYNYNKYMRNAMISDPQNRGLFESYIQKSLLHERSEDIKFVIQLLISTISIDKVRDKIFVNDHWKEIKDCFNINTLIWNDSPYTDTYQAKSLYFASLCLAKKKDYPNAKELLRIATNSRPSWSYIYVDYASIVWWNEINYERAMNILNLCKKNIHAKQHCSEFETGDFLSNSVFDSTINFEK